jgi:hypothetical protein
MVETTVRGVIDRFEGEYAVVVLDDRQQLDWPRAALPPGAQPGMAVAIQVKPAMPSKRRVRTDDVQGASASQITGWHGRWIANVQTGERLIQLADGQQVRWPVTPELAAQAEGSIVLQLVPDAEETRARREKVAKLVDDIFGNRK